MSDSLKEFTAKRMGANADEFFEIDEERAEQEISEMSFCKNLIDFLNQEIPEEFSNRRFYKWSNQSEDIHICWGKQLLISIQIDPLCEVICALGGEYGYWDKEYNAVLSFFSEYKKVAHLHNKSVHVER